MPTDERYADIVRLARRDEYAEAREPQPYIIAWSQDQIGKLAVANDQKSNRVNHLDQRLHNLLCDHHYDDYVNGGGSFSRCLICVGHELEGTINQIDPYYCITDTPEMVVELVQNAVQLLRDWSALVRDASVDNRNYKWRLAKLINQTEQILHRFEFVMDGPEEAEVGSKESDDGA